MSINFPQSDGARERGDHHYFLIPAARGRGLAMSLDNFAMDVLRRHGFYRAWLQVAPDNTPAIKFYRMRPVAQTAVPVAARRPHGGTRTDFSNTEKRQCRVRWPCPNLRLKENALGRLERTTIEKVGLFSI